MAAKVLILPRIARHDSYLVHSLGRLGHFTHPITGRNLYLCGFDQEMSSGLQALY